MNSFFFSFLGAFWLNPPLPMDEDGNWVGPTRPQQQSFAPDVDPA